MAPAVTMLASREPNMNCHRLIPEGLRSSTSGLVVGARLSRRPRKWGTAAHPRARRGDTRNIPRQVLLVASDGAPPVLCGPPRRESASMSGGCQRYPRRILTTYSPPAPMTSKPMAMEVGRGSDESDAGWSRWGLGSVRSSTMPPTAMGVGWWLSSRVLGSPARLARRRR